MHSSQLEKSWGKLSFNEQLGNIGSEVGRSISSKSKATATERALELLDLTISDDRWQGPRRKEITIAKESYIEATASNNKESLDKLNKYFHYFALASRLNK